MINEENIKFIFLITIYLLMGFGFNRMTAEAFRKNTRTVIKVLVFIIDLFLWLPILIIFKINRYGKI